MAKEKELYKETLDVVRDKFGLTQMIPLKDVSSFMGVDQRRLKEDKEFPVKKIGGRYFVGVLALANYLSQL